MAKQLQRLGLSAWVICCCMSLAVTSMAEPVTPPETQTHLKDSEHTLQGKLVQACINGDIASARRALEQGAQLEQPYGNALATPLMLAIYRDHDSLVQYFIQAGAQLEAQNRNGKTALMIAANGGQFQIVQYLVQAGAQIERS